MLSAWEKIPVCVAYDVDGKRVEDMPVNQSDFHHAKPIFMSILTVGIVIFPRLEVRRFA